MSKMKVKRIQFGIDNCFLVEGDNGAILIDTSRTRNRDKIFNECKDRNIRLIVLTHGHVDHIQNAAALSKSLGAPIAMHRADFRLIKNNMEEPLIAHTLLGKIILASTMKFGLEEIEPFEPDIYLSDGDSLEPYGVKATVIGLPGHTQGSLGILLGDSDLFVGDALMNIVAPVKSPIYGDRANMTKSAAKISAFKGITVHFGHGKPVANRKWT